MVAKRGKTSPPGSNKKQKVVEQQAPTEPTEEDIRDQKLDMIVQAIEDNAKESEVKEILVQGVKLSFRDPKDIRHDIHSEFISMVEENLTQYVDTMKQQLDEIQNQIDNADQIKEDNVQQKNDLEAKLEKKKEEIEAKKVEVAQLEDNYNEALLKKVNKTEATGLALAPMNQMKKDLEEAEEKQNIFEDLFTNNENNLEAGRKSKIGVIASYLKNMGASSSLTVSAPVVLSKKMRTDFDTGVLDEIWQLFKAHVEKLKASIATETTTHHELVIGLQAAEQAATEAENAQHVAKQELAGLNSEKKELENKKKAVDKLLNSHDKIMKTNAESLKTITASHEHLKHVYETAIALRDRTDKVPECSENQEQTPSMVE